MESAVLGTTIMYGDEVMPAYMAVGVQPNWFTGVRVSIWSAILQLHADGKKIDSITVSQRVSGGQSVVDPYMDVPFHKGNVGQYALELRQYHIRDCAVTAVTQTAEAIKTATPADVIQIVTDMAHEIAELNEHQDGNVNIPETTERMVTEWSNPPADEQGGKVHWPLVEMEHMFGGLSDEFIFLCAKESVGKSAFSCQFALTAAENHHVISILSIESAASRTLARMVAQAGQVNTWRLHRNMFDDAEQRGQSLDKAREAKVHIDKLPLRINDAPHTLSQVQAWGEIEAKTGSEMLIIDNMRHIQPDWRYGSPVEQFRDYALRLKWLRDRVRIPVMILHHLTDEGDVAWSRDIRRDADVLLYMTRQEGAGEISSRANGWQGHDVVVFHAEKVRDGARGFDIELRFDVGVQTFKAKRDTED